MGKQLEKALLPEGYECYVFDLYGTLVDIRTEEERDLVWEKLALFYGYYGARYEPSELRERYGALVAKREQEQKSALESEAKYAHEASPEIEITDVFLALFEEKGVDADRVLAVHAGQFFRILATDYVRTYPGTSEMLAHLRKQAKRIYLLSNAQRIFTEYEMHTLGIAEYFDDILISSDYQTKKPDQRFFEILIQRHMLCPEKTLFVGNDSHTDIAGARRAGMHTFYVRSNISPEGDSAGEADYFVQNFTAWEYC